MLEGIVFNMKENGTTQRFKRQREKGLSDTYSRRERGALVHGWQD